MKRFNLLLVNTDIHVAHQIVKLVYRVFRKNFIFEVEEEDKAETLLTKLNIDMVIVDLDDEDLDLKYLQERFPRQRFVGIISENSDRSSFNPKKTSVFRKELLSTEFLAELKAIKKVNQENRASIPGASESSASFTDYNVLAMESQN